MRRLPVLLGALLAVAVVAVGGGGLASSAQAPPARLRLADADPVTLRGTGFQPNEHVRITVVAGDRLVRRATAGTGGAFTMRLPSVDENVCAGFSVTATGDRGSRASYKRAPGVCALP